MFQWNENVQSKQHSSLTKYRAYVKMANQSNLQFTAIQWMTKATTRHVHRALWLWKCSKPKMKIAKWKLNMLFNTELIIYLKFRLKAWTLSVCIIGKTYFFLVQVSITLALTGWWLAVVDVCALFVLYPEIFAVVVYFLLLVFVVFLYLYFSFCFENVYTQLSVTK